ncbi:hypothetical protein RF55_22400, partial [Lasius niger]
YAGGGVKDGLLHQPWARGDQAAQVAAMRIERVQGQGGAYADQYPGARVFGVGGNHRQKTVNAQLAGVGIAVADAAGGSRGAQPLETLAGMLVQEFLHA